MTSDNNIQFYYHLLLASMYPDKCALAFFGSRTDNYWQLFWAHVAFIKTGNVDNATVLLPRMGGFGCPQGDIAPKLATNVCETSAEAPVFSSAVDIGIIAAISTILQFHWNHGRDSVRIITPFVQVGTYPTRNFATLGPL